MACLTVEVFQVLSLLISAMIVINWAGHLVYLFSSETHTTDKYQVIVVIAYWTTSVVWSLINELTKSVYLLSLALLFAIQGLALSMSLGRFGVISYLLIVYAVACSLVKASLEIIILRYKSVNMNVDQPLNVLIETSQLNEAKYHATMKALKQNRDSRNEIIILRVFAYCATGFYFTFVTIRFWSDIFDIPNHAFRASQLIFPITLLVTGALLLYMTELIIYRKDSRLLCMIVLFSPCLLSFFLTHHIYNFSFLLAYLTIITLIYLLKLFY